MGFLSISCNPSEISIQPWWNHEHQLVGIDHLDPTVLDDMSVNPPTQAVVEPATGLESADGGLQTRQSPILNVAGDCRVEAHSTLHKSSRVSSFTPTSNGLRRLAKPMLAVNRSVMDISGHHPERVGVTVLDVAVDCIPGTEPGAVFVVDPD